MRMVESYPEKRIQTEAIDWLRSARGYVETFGDAEATGARMDSVGLLDGRPVAIEVKPAVSSGMVRHRAGASGSIESKLAATLRALGGREPWLSAFHEHWDRSTYPMLVVLAERYSDSGLAELAAMLAERAAEWQFAYEVWRWTGRVIETVASNTGAVAMLRREAGVVVPLLAGSAVRPAPPTIEQFADVAMSAGLGAVFSSAIEAARERRLRFVRKVSGIGLGGRAGGGEWATVFVTDCDASTGLNVGVDLGPLGMNEDDLPGAPAPKRGHMRCNRWIRTPAEATGLIALLAERRTVSGD